MKTHSANVTRTETIDYATTSTSLGLVLIATSSKGLCAVLIGSDARPLITDLRHRFPAVKLVRRDSLSMPFVHEIVDAIESPVTTVDIPLDMRGSDFAKSVWQALREISVGSTATYKQIAQKIGPTAMAKNVGEACAANPFAIIVPCHRVIRSDGSLGGYRWSIKRKQLLLDREKRAVGVPDAVRDHIDRINWLFGPEVSEAR